MLILMLTKKCFILAFASLNVDSASALAACTLSQWIGITTHSVGVAMAGLLDSDYDVFIYIAASFYKPALLEKRGNSPCGLI